MFNRELYLESVLSQLSGKTGEDAYVSTLADVVLHAELDRGHGKAKNNNQDVKPRRESVEVLTGLRANADKHVLLLGKPGSGKSTALKRLLREDAEKCLLNPELKIPVLLELRRLGANTSIESLLAKALSVPRYRVKPENIADLLDEYPFLLLLDGLNELPSGSGLYDWRKDFFYVSMIFTSRDLGGDSYFDIDTRLSMLPLTEEQAKDLIKNRLGNELTFRMLHSLNGRIKELTDTPLFLGMLCDVYQPLGNIVHNQGELFRKFTHEEYKKRKSKNSVTPRHNEFFDFCDEILQEIAFYMMDADGDGKNLWLQVKRTDIEKRLEKYFRDKDLSDAPSKVKQWLDDALKFHLLQCVDGENKIEFTHQLFQEYYATEWLLEHLGELSDGQLCTYFLNPIKWTESIFMLMDLTENTMQAERIVKLALDVDVTLASRLSGRVKEEWQDSVFKVLFSCLKENEINEYVTVNVMRYNKTKYSVKYIVEFLEENRIVSEFDISEWDWIKLFEIILDVECEESLQYVQKIIEMDFLHMPSTVVVLLAPKNEASKYEMKILASKGFGDSVLLFSEKEKPRILIKYLSEYCSNNSIKGVRFSQKTIVENPNHVKWMAMRTLWKWRIYNAFIKSLSSVYKLPDHEYDYLEIISTVDEQGKYALLEIIDFPLLRVEKYPKLSLITAHEQLLVLRRVATRALINFIKEDLVLNKLINLLDDKDYGVCCISAEILGASSEDKSINALLAIVENSFLIEGDDDKSKKISDYIYNAQYLFNLAVLSLKKLKSTEAKELLLNLFDTLEDAKKPLCIEALVGIDCKEAIPKFINCLSRNYKYSTVRKAAIQALGIIGSESEVQYLLKILQDDDFSVKQESIISLDRILKGEICEETISLIVESLFLELDAVRGISEAVFKEYKFYQGVANLPLGEQCRNKIYSQECNTNSSQYIKYTQYMNFILVTLEYVAAKYTNHPICLRIISYTLDAVSISKNTETRSLVLNLLGQIPHYKAIEKWLDEAKCNEKYIAEWSGLINKLAQGGSSYPSVYPNAYKYPQEMHCHFTSKNEKNKFNLAIDKLEAFHSKYRHFYGGGINSKRGENTSYASEFCKKENIINLFQELTQKKDNIGYRNRVLGRIFNYCPDYWPKLTEWVSDHAPDLSESLRILQGISDCKHEYIELAFSSLKNNDFPWKDIISDKIEKCPECLPKLKLLSLQKPENIQKFNFPRILQSSQNNCGYYSYEWFEKSKKISTILSGENQLNNDENFGFLSIVRKIHSTLSEYERFPPEAYKGMGEDGVRNYLSASLKACYFKVAIVTRETENRHGKTDILIKKTNGDNVFIAECKIWKGNSELSKAINQLLEYLTRKDNKAVILFFVPTRDVKKIIDKSKHQIKAHDNFIQYYEEFEYSSHGYHCLFKNTAADDSDIDLAILFYHLEEVQQRHNDR